MPFYSYAYAAGFDQTSLTNIETTLTTMPKGGIKGKIVPLGSVKRRTLNQYAQWNGTREVKWLFPALSLTDFGLLMSAFFGGYTTQNAEMTIDTRSSDNSFDRFNVIANRPVEGEDYTRREFGKVEDLTVTFRIIAEI